MSDPIATPEDLAIYLNIVGDIDSDRAVWLLARAQEKCEQILSPLPDTALGVVCDIAGRAYRAPASPTMDSPGPYMDSVVVGGSLFISKANMAELRRLDPKTSKGQAFSVTPFITDYCADGS